MVGGDAELGCVTATRDHDGLLVVDTDVLHDHPREGGVVDQSLGHAVLDARVGIDVHPGLLGQTLFQHALCHDYRMYMIVF